MASFAQQVLALRSFFGMPAQTVLRANECDGEGEGSWVLLEAVGGAEGPSELSE